MYARMSSSLALALLVLVGACAKKEAPPPPPPLDVKVATVLQKDVPIQVEAIGETRGSEEIEIQARVEGFLETIHFQEGMPVRKGQLLFTIDPKQYEATLAQARGALARGRGAARARDARTSTASSRWSSRTPSRGRTTTTPCPSAAAARSRASPPRRAVVARRGDRPRLHARLLADRRARRQGRGATGQPGRPRPDHAADPHLEDRPHPRALQHQRA